MPKTDWETPDYFFRALDAEYHFDLDVCALPHNAKCARYYTPEQDGLKQHWTGTCWMNPPYGEPIAAWLDKAYQSSLQGATVACLVPANTDVGWFHYYAPRGEVRLYRGRIKFVGASGSPDFGSAVIIFGPRAKAGTVIYASHPAKTTSTANVAGLFTAA